jgi:hypothetical protein
MNIHPDFEDFLRFLNDEEVDFLIVGGYAVAFHGYVRATNDMDLFFRNTEETIAKIAKALERFGLPTTGEERKRFSDPGNIIRMGVPPVRMEMINNISGVSFAEAWDHRVKGMYGQTLAWYISLPDLLRNKRASGRPKDLVDFDELGGNRNS